MSNQEQEVGFINHPQEEEEELLLLHQTTTTLDSSSLTHDHLPCTSCGHHKRPSPEPSSFQQTAHKKPNNHLNGFSKIPLPTQDQPLLRRCSSDPISPPNVLTNTTPQSPPQNAEIPRPETPLSAARASAAKLPPRAPTLRRSVSDPNPSPSNTFSGSCGTMAGHESPNDKQRLRRMRDCIREMNKWWDEILPEEQNAAINNSATLETSDEDIEESVSVERAGEFLIVHFKCPCRKGYQILISGKNCYYKLM